MSTQKQDDETGTPLHAHEDDRDQDAQGDTDNPVGTKMHDGADQEPGQTQDGTPADGPTGSQPVEPDQEGDEADGLGSKTGGEGGGIQQEG